MSDHAERDHALLSASGASRWLACPPSARLEEQFPDTSSEHAKEGTLAHEIAELKLRKYYIEPMGTRKFNNRLKKFKENKLFQEEMLKHTDTYLEYVQSITNPMKNPPFVTIEKRLDYSQYVPEGFGTGDCIVIGEGTLHVIDFKYGKGVPVDAEDNPQMKLYALGAYKEYGLFNPIHTVKMIVVQPRLFDTPSEATLTLEELLAWGEEIKPIADKAFRGEGEFSPGEHCKFCRAKAQCRARADQYTALSDFGQVKPPLINNDEVGEILEKAKGLDSWIKALKDYALKEALKGNQIKGWKAVNGRGGREFVDQDKAFEHLKENGVDEALLYNRVPLTVPQIEKVLKTKEYKTLLEETGHVKKLPGKPTLAPESDKRESVRLAPDAGEDFK